MAQRSVTRRPRATRAERRTAITERLIAAIGRLTGDGTSFTALSVEQIAAEAGLARSTFYAYFEDKPALTRALADHLYLAFIEVTAPLREAGDDLRQDRVRTVLGTVLRLHRDHYPMIAALTETAAYDPAIATLFRDTIESLAATLAGHVTAVTSPATVRDIDLRRTMSAIIWMIERTCYQLTPGADDEALDSLARTLAAITWHALRPDTIT